MLSRILGVEPPKEVLGDALSTALVEGPTAQTLPTLFLAWMQGARPHATALKIVTSKETEYDIFDAAAADLEYRITGDPSLLARALALLARLAVRGGLYAAVKAGPGS
jgi:hypothetical protein